MWSVVKDILFSFFVFFVEKRSAQQEAEKEILREAADAREIERDSVGSTVDELRRVQGLLRDNKAD